MKTHLIGHAVFAKLSYLIKVHDGVHFSLNFDFIVVDFSRSCNQYFGNNRLVQCRNTFTYTAFSQGVTKQCIPLDGSLQPLGVVSPPSSFRSKRGLCDTAGRLL